MNTKSAAKSREKIESWGRYPNTSQIVYDLNWRTDFIQWSPADGAESILPVGLLRSYGDSCLNDGGAVLRTSSLSHFVSFDELSGQLHAEAGISLAEILRLIVPRGWFLPVTPGTKFVTLAGAVANDVHGKNHHHSGTFGSHVLFFDLVRSDGSSLRCSPSQNQDLFNATIGGLGLTGIITTVCLQLKPVSSAEIKMQSIKYHTLDDFFQLSRESDQDFEYTVAWIDGLARGKNLGRGHFLRGNHFGSDRVDSHLLTTSRAKAQKTPRLAIPFDFPKWALNPVSIKAFNFLYFHRQIQKQHDSITNFEPFFYPLDSINNWNRIYGRRGFLQYQFVIPDQDAAIGCREILGRIAASKQGSFLAVLKMFGDMSSPGLLSFPRPGVTLALDFANCGEKTFSLLRELDQAILDLGGRVYPAKDARMSADHFQKFYPNWREFSKFIDPAISSSFWRRVTGQTNNRTNKEVSP